MIDGNTATLREYEKQQDRQNMAQAAMEARVQPFVTHIGKLYQAALAAGEINDFYDWEEDIAQMVKDELEL